MKKLRWLAALVVISAIASPFVSAADSKKSDDKKDEETCDCKKDKDGKTCGVDKDCCCTGDKATHGQKKG